MKTNIMILFTLIFSFNLISQDAKTIVNRCTAALGGEEAVRRFSDYQAEGDVKFSMYSYEFPGKIDIIQKGRK